MSSYSLFPVIEFSFMRSTCFFFFFSSRRRHTRCLSDWSSDVCSSDLRGAGFKAELRIEGSPRPLPPGVDVTAFRVIQEGLTNTLKHAPGASADVLIRYRSEERRVGKECRAVRERGRVIENTSKRSARG